MPELPADLLTLLPSGTGPIAQAWWDALPEADRRRIVGLWDERLEVRFFAPQHDEAGDVDDWDDVPAVRHRAFRPREDESEGGQAFLERLLEDPDLILAYEPESRTFHICTRHAAAQACLRAGSVPTDFACPVADAGCPMLPLRGARLVRRPSMTS